AVHCESIKLPRKTNCEVTDIYHFLDLPESLLIRFTHLVRDKFTTSFFPLAKCLTKLATAFTSTGSRPFAPFYKRFTSLINDRIVSVPTRRIYTAYAFAIDGRKRLNQI